LDFFPDRVTKQKRYNNTMLLRVESEVPPTVQLRIKIEINCYEHFNVMGYTKVPFEVNNTWFSGKCETTTYQFEELLGTKLRALYQRKKGRDLFDLYIALTSKDVNTDNVLMCYQKYMDFVVAQPPTYKQYISNLDLKMHDPDFLSDMDSLIRPGTSFSPEDGYNLVKEMLIDKLKK